MSDEEQDDDFIREIVVPPLIVPEKWPSSIDEADLEDVKNPDTRKILLKMSQLQKAINFAIGAQVQCREYQIIFAHRVNKLQLQVFNLRNTSKTASGWATRVKWALLIVSAVVLQELAKRWLVDLLRAKP